VTSPAGWHPDPVPPTEGAAPQLRYWDGTRWTEHVAPASATVQTPQVGQTQPAAYAGTYGQVYDTPPWAGARPEPTTPDGERLAGWWQRVLASILDGIVLGIIGLLIALPWWRDIFHAYTDWFDEAINSGSTGATVDPYELQRHVMRPLLVIGAINLALGFVYTVGFLMWKQATPGKLIVGLRVRLRESPGPMPIGTVLLRWVGQYGVGIIGLIPYVGSVGSLYTLLDSLWPLWDDKKQALHDKLAKTNVVQRR
jgi:uncharacterized RDD family membrane protein YckC